MSDVRLYMNKVNGWEKMDTAMTANDAEVSHLGFKPVAQIAIELRTLDQLFTREFC